MYSDDKTQKKISLMQHQVQPFSASKYSNSFQKANKCYPGPGFPLDVFNSLERLSVHTIHARGCKDNEYTSCTVIIISTSNYTQDILLLVQCHLLSQEENQWLSWAHELCRPLPCWNNSIFYLQKCHQVSCKNSLTQFLQNTKHILKSKFILHLATTEWLRNGFVFNPHFCLECCAYTAWRQTESKHGATVTATTPTEIFLSGKTGLQVCVPSTPVQTYSERLQRYVCVQKLTKFFKTQNALESPKFELLSLWCLNCKLEYLWVLTLPGTKKGFLVQISFSVLANKIKGNLGEKSLTKKPSSSLAVSVQWVSSQNSEYSAFLHLQF